MDKNKIIALLIMVTVFIAVPSAMCVVYGAYYQLELLEYALVYSFTIGIEAVIFIIPVLLYELYEYIYEYLD